MEILSGETMKYSVGDMIVETCFNHKQDWRPGYVTNVTEDILSKYIICITWFGSQYGSQYEYAYTSEEIDGWIVKNTVQHYPLVK